MSGLLMVAATPIGNLSDSSQRLAEVLAGADLIVAEDTRVSSRLLAHLAISKPMRSLHEHNEKQLIDGLLRQLDAGDTLVLISDAGTPLISDPGFRLIRAAHASGQAVVPVPGPSAVTAALSVAGLPTDRFTFCGFLAPRAAERRRQLAELARRPETLVIFEACHRIARLLEDAVSVMAGDRPAFLGREMTKRFEQYVHADLAALAQQVAAGTIAQRGEFVLIVGGAPPEPATSADAANILSALAEELPTSQAARVAARITGLPRKTCYQRIQDLKNTGQ